MWPLLSLPPCLPLGLAVKQHLKLCLKPRLIGPIKTRLTRYHKTLRMGLRLGMTGTMTAWPHSRLGTCLSTHR